MIDVDDAIVPDVYVGWVRRQTPQYIERRCSADHDEWQHAPTAFPGRFEEHHAEGRLER